MNYNSLIYEPLNGVSFLVFGAFLAVFTLIGILMRKKSESFKGAVLAWMMIATVVGFFMYKYALSVDTDYEVILDQANKGGFRWWSELPLQLCNINMILIPVAIFTKKRPLFNFCFFMGPLGAAMALLMPSIGFEAYSILLPRMMGYYFTHLMVFFGSIALVAYGLYKPKFRDIIPTVITVLCVSFCIFLIDMLMRRTGINEYANYFYLVETEGNPVLELLHSWIPYPYLYILPCTPVLILYMLLIISVIRLCTPEKTALLGTKS